MPEGWIESEDRSFEMVRDECYCHIFGDEGHFAGGLVDIEYRQCRIKRSDRFVVDREYVLRYGEGAVAVGNHFIDFLAVVGVGNIEEPVIVGREIGLNFQRVGKKEMIGERGA